jgi:hypothetical protein
MFMTRGMPPANSQTRFTASEVKTSERFLPVQDLEPAADRDSFPEGLQFPGFPFPLQVGVPDEDELKNPGRKGIPEKSPLPLFQRFLIQVLCLVDHHDHGLIPGAPLL